MPCIPPRFTKSRQFAGILFFCRKKNGILQLCDSTEKCAVFDVMQAILDGKSLHDQLQDGRCIRLLNVLDDVTRKGLSALRLIFPCRRSGESAPWRTSLNGGVVPGRFVVITALNM